MNRIDKSAIDNALSHIGQEIGFENIRISIESNYEMIQKAHDSIHEFMYLVSFCLPDQPGVSWHSRSAFLCYHWEAFHQAHRSLLDALSGYYNSAYVLLRNTVELLLRGAFWECLAHKEFREKAAILEKHKGKRRSLKDWIDSLIEQKPSIEKYLEETSAAIFDRTAILFDDRHFQREFVDMPLFSTLIQQLIEWGVIDIPNSYDKLYADIYSNLSRDVHSVPDTTDVGRKLVLGKDFMETEVISSELNGYIKLLQEIIDIGIVIELNLLRDWIRRGGRNRLKDRLSVLQDLGLQYSARKLNDLIR